MSKVKERMPFNVGDEVEFSMLNWHKVTGIVECACFDWARLKDGTEVRLDYVWKLKVIKRADVAKEAEEFLRKECPDANEKKKN